MSDLPSPTTQVLLDANQIAALAREQVMAIKPIESLLTALGVSQQQFEQIKETPFYKNVAKTFAIEWESATSTNKRLALQAQAALEEALPALARRMLDEKEALPAVVQTAQFIGKLAGAGEEKPAASGAERFKIIFNLGADTVKFDEKTKDPALQATVVEGTVVHGQSILVAPSVSNEENVGPDLSGFPTGEGSGT